MLWAVSTLAIPKSHEVNTFQVKEHSSSLADSLLCLELAAIFLRMVAKL